MSSRWDKDKLKRLIREQREQKGHFEGLADALREAREEIDDEDATQDVDASEVAEPQYRGLTFGEIREAYWASLAEDEEKGRRGSKPNVAKRLGVSESTLVRAWSDLHGGYPPEWPTGLELNPRNVKP